MGREDWGDISMPRKMVSCQQFGGVGPEEVVRHHHGLPLALVVVVVVVVCRSRLQFVVHTKIRPASEYVRKYVPRWKYVCKYGVSVGVWYPRVVSEIPG